MQYKQYDIIILGAGIAGATLAYLFRDTPYKILQVDRVGITDKIKFGESLPPTSIAMLRRLKIEPILKKNSLHYKIYGYQSAWGTKQIRDYRFKHYPVNYGWKIDKTALIADLETATNIEQVSYQKKDRIELKEDGIHIISSANQVKAIKSRMVVDATGRNSRIARQLGIRRTHADQLISYTGNIEATELPAFHRATVTEAFSSGWGLVSKLVDEVVAFSLFTVKHKLIPNPMKEEGFWKGSLKETTCLKHFFPKNKEIILTGKAANSSMLTKTCGENWLAIGDAALAFDPLCSHGVTTAIYAAELAKQFIDKKFSSNQLLSGYHQNLKQIYQAYLQQRQQIYRAEQRWKTFPFWQLNHGI